jgi:membrane-associated phospholipid phosphatase
VRFSWLSAWGSKQSLLAGALLLAAFVCLTIVTQPGGSAFIDNHVSQISHHLASGRRFHLFSVIAPFGSPEGSIVLTAVLAIAVARVRGWAAGFGIIAVMGATTLIEGVLRVRVADIPWNDLGHFIAQPRGRHLVHSTYPSGHTARLALLSGIALAGLVPARWRLAGLLGVLLLTAWIAVQRVAANQHTGTDVVGGALLGWGAAFLYAWLIAAIVPGWDSWLAHRRSASDAS